MKKILIAATLAAMLTMPAQANAFSLRKFIANPFKASINSILNPFHVVYKLNKAFGHNPTTGIPKIAFTPANEQHFKETGQWRWSWEGRDMAEKAGPPVIPDPLRPIVRPDPIAPPPDVVVTPPCFRGGKGITPC